MSILNCILQKFQAQKPTFTEGENQVKYEDLPQLKKDALQKAGLITKEQLDLVQDRINSKIANGMSEQDAAAAVHSEMLAQTHENAIKLARVSDAVSRTIDDIVDARSRGVSDTKIAKSLFTSSAGDDARYGGIIKSGQYYEGNYKFAETRYASLLDPVIQKIPSSLSSVPSIKEEFKFAQALWGQGNHTDFNQAVNALNKFKDTANKDLVSVGRTGYENPDIIKSLWSDGTKVRGNLSKWDSFMSDPSKFDWTFAQKKYPGLYDTAEQQAIGIKEIRRQTLSEGTVRSEGLNQTDLMFKTPEDFMEYQQKFGQGGLMQIMSNMLEHYSREYSVGRTFGGSTGQFRNGLLNYIAETNPERFTDFQKNYDAQQSYMLANRNGASDILTQGLAKGLKDAVVASSLGFAGVASVFHLGIGAVNASNQGLSGGAIAGGVVKNFLKSALAPEDFKLFQGRMAEQQINADVAINALKRAIDSDKGNVANRFLAKSASSVSTLSGLVNMGKAAKLVMSNVLRQDLAKFIDSGKSVEGNAEFLRRGSFTDQDAAALRPFLYDNNNGYSPVKEIDLAGAYNSNDINVQNAAIKVHSMMDQGKRSLFPHGDTRMDQAFSAMRNSGPLGTVIDALTRPLTGYLGGFFQDVMRPMTSQGGYGSMQSVVGGSSLALAILAMGSLQVQARRLQQGLDPLPVGADLALRAASTSSFGPIMAHLGLDSLSAHKADLGLMDSFAGAKPISDAFSFGKNLVESGVGGKQSRATKDGLKLVNDILPGKSLPVVGLLYQRLISDNIMKALDPVGAAHSFQLAQQHAQKEGSDQYWPKGSPAPTHNPFTK